VSADTLNDPLVKKVNDQLGTLEQLVSFPAGKSPTVDDIRKVHDAVERLMEDIQHKPDGK
jgi:hypothetical protein